MKRYILKIKFIVPMILLLLLGLIVSMPESIDPGNLFVRDAEAVVGRPATPGSVAGAGRRTRRRTVRRVTRRHIAYGMRYTILPVGYTTVVVVGVTYHLHEGVYYKPYYEGNTIVYVVVENPDEKFHIQSQ